MFVNHAMGLNFFNIYIQKVAFRRCTVKFTTAFFNDVGCNRPDDEGMLCYFEEGGAAL